MTRPIQIRRLDFVSLRDALMDPLDRSTMAMSTLIASDLWLLEAGWDGMELGDIQVYKNESCQSNGLKIPKIGPDKKPMKDAAGEPVYVADQWIWWGGVPRAMIKHYRFQGERPKPGTLEDAPPFADAERKEEARQARTGTARA